MAPDPLSSAHGPGRDPPKQWASRDARIQSADGISNSAREHGGANSALGPILEMRFPGQIRILNALADDSYSTGNAPPSGKIIPYILILISPRMNSMIP